MKKQLLSLGLMLAAAFTLTNCSKEIEAPVQEPESVGYPFEIVASTVDTKTVNDGMSTKWVAGDKINVFHALGESTEYVNDGAFTVSDVESGLFTGEVAEQLDVEEEYDWYVMYPYSDKFTTPGAKTAGYTYIGYSSGLNQTGYNSMASLKGSVCPLYGTAKYAGVRPEITMNHLSSIIAINVTNENEEPLTISTASFTATEDIVGSYYIDITGETVVYTPSSANYVKTEAIVNVSGGTALAQGESAILYAAIKPFTAPAGEKLTLSVNGYSKEITLTNDVTFTAGKIKTLNFGYDYVAEPEPEGTATYSWDLTKASYSSASSTEVKWESDYVSMVLTKGSSTTNANNYLGGTNAHTRVYKDQVLTFTSAEGVIVQSVEFNVVSGYIDEFEGATWTNATAATSGLVRKVVPTDSSKDFSVKIGSATRFNTVTVYYVLDENYVPPTLESIKVVEPKTEYNVGDTFAKPNVFAVYDNGNEINVTESATFDGFNSTAAVETQTITVTYEDKTTSYTISVKEVPTSGDEGGSANTLAYTFDVTSFGTTGYGVHTNVAKNNNMTWTITCGQGGYLGINKSANAGKLVLGTYLKVGTPMGYTSSTLATAVITTSAMANVGKVEYVAKSVTAVSGTAPTKISLVYSEDGGNTYSLVETQTFSQNNGNVFEFTPKASAHYAVVFYGTAWFRLTGTQIKYYTN